MRLKKLSIFLVLSIITSLSFQMEAAKLRTTNHFTKMGKPMVIVNDEDEEAEDVSGEIIVKTAMQYLGVPYRSGKSSPKGFDCSGFTSYVYKQFSVNLNRDSRSQYTQGTPIKQKDLRAGDLVFWKGSNKNGSIGHVGIVTEVADDGSFKFVHAAIHGGIRVDDSREAYYVKRFVGARRIIDDENTKSEKKVQ